MMMDRAIDPEQEEKEREEDQIDHQRNKRKLIDVSSSAKLKGKVPMCSTDLSADNVFDKEPHRKIAKLMANYPRTSPPVGSSLEMDSSKEPNKSVTKYSASSSSDVPIFKSNNGKLHKSRGLGHVVSHNTTSCAERASQGNNGEQEVQGLLETRDFLSSWGNNDEPQVPEFLETRYSWGNNEEIGEPGLLEDIYPLLKKILKTGKGMDVDVPETSKKKEKSRTKKRKLDFMCTSRENMLSFLKDLPQLQMEAICALYRQDRKTGGQTTLILSDSHYSKVKFLAEFLTDGNVHGPSINTAEELEETCKGSMTFCWCLVSIYSSELYHIYCGGLDPYFC